MYMQYVFRYIIVPLLCMYIYICYASYLRLYIYAYTGKDQFRAEVGPWMTLGQDALVSEDDYMPDFSAYVGKCSVV